ncbi:mitochondrial 37S ribosomal protein YmS18 [Moesziomyces antarcticus]|uniref:Related to ribosomal protein YmS18, mitochondrial n=2 Tax=Pseudozyma antarctica TaxID=84753 RepID=A0A5C3FY54_PSEA2|nr:mitochondrial 37S ribosomal protein YmS18 [Moesziomyces antarcticus]GAK67492.1 mitochondrial 37S ribosomal protein YmS18 [Moesziomyces antarcticus]SPO48755.1 related to ribosomal protein YmS18, mitochondrial [Moesziomyces antarcticus]
MLRAIARQCAPARRLVASDLHASQFASTSLVRPRTFASSSARCNSDADKSASTQQLESQASEEPSTDPSPAGSATVSDALQRQSSQEADADASSSSSGRQPASSNLDDILGSVSAFSSLPGADAAGAAGDAADDASGASFRDAGRNGPAVRGAMASRYSSPLFSSSSAQPHRLFVNASRNNTILTLTSPSGDPLASASGGSVGFKKAARSGYEAGYRAAFAMFGKINEFKDAWRISHLEVLWNGFGQGREAVYRAMLAGEGQATKNLISKMTDNTPVKIGGVRPKKRRML